MASINYGSLPFSEQIKFFRNKVNIPTRAWTDLYAAEHEHGFMVAGAMRNDLLADLRKSIDKVIEQGVTLEQFRKDFDSIVEKHGWSYNGGRNWRTRVIYDTNLRQSYNAGRHEQMLAVSKTRPYWRYRHNEAVENPRAEHKAWDNLVLPFDDPFWQTHTPQNAWGCQCYLETLSERDLKKLGKDGPDTAPPIEWEEKTIGIRGPSPRTVKVPKGIDPGFEYAPGNSWIKSRTPKITPGTPQTYPSAASRLPAMPKPKATTLAKFADGMSEQEYAQAFLDELGANGKPAFAFKDVANEYLPLSSELFIDHRGKWKIKKEGRHIELAMLAATIKDPDEIWLAWQPVKSGHDILRRRYIRVFPDEPHGVAVFELDKTNWREITIFHVTDEVAQRHGHKNARAYIEAQRGGLRVFKREDGNS